MKNEKPDNADPQTIILRKYKEPVVQILKELATHRKISSVCREKMPTVNPVRLTEIHTGKRELTPYYLEKMVKGELVTLKTILQGRKLEDLPKEDQITLRKIFMPDRRVELLGKLEDQGMDIDAILESMASKNNNEK